VNKDIYHIANDYFSGRISESDLSFLQSWLAETPENKQLFVELEKIWKITGELSFKLNPDVDLEWDRFLTERSKQHDTNIPSIGRQIQFRQILKIAAVLIPAMLIVSVFYIYMTKGAKAAELLTINTTDQKKECTLPDGTKVWINKNSNFVYPSEFSDSERVVKLDGEAYFEVVKTGKSFKIETAKTQILVVGTAFNVRAVKSEKFSEVVVTSGTVIFKEIKSSNNTVLVKGEKGTYNELTGEITREKYTDENLVGWKNDQLLFQDTPLSDIESILSRYFNVKVQVAPSMKQCKFTGEFNQAPLDEILKVISISLDATYEIKNDTVFLDGKGCKD
jgi:transmembrane sensor